MSKKMVFKSNMEGEKMKTQALKAVAGSGVDFVEVNMDEGTVTAVGDADPVYLTRKLRKVGCRTQLLSVGPVEEEKKNPEKEEDAEEEEEDAMEEAPPVVYPSGYGYPPYMVVRDEYRNGWMLLL